LAPQITGGSTALTKAGSGTWTLTNNTNDYTGVNQHQLAAIFSIATITDGGVASPIGAATNVGGQSRARRLAPLKYTGPTASTNRLFTLSGVSGIDSSGTGSA